MSGQKSLLHRNNVMIQGVWVTENDRHNAVSILPDAVL